MSEISTVPWDCEVVDSPTSYGSAVGLPSPRAIVAIPAQNEQAHIERCLDALNRQEGVIPGGLGIVLFLNNCSDGTQDIAKSFAATMLWPILIIDETFTGATAGWARRRSMETAAAWLSQSRDDGILLTTDADSRVAPDWVAKNIAYLDRGADIVAGRITLDPTDAAMLPDALHARGRLEAEYELLLTEIGARLDPDPGNPWPCHWSKSGATLAVHHAVYTRVGGMPSIDTGEDRAFVDAVRSHDLIARHPIDIEVITSGRLDGRATGGVAETIKLRCDKPDSPCDDRLESLYRFVRRVLWCRRLRLLYADHMLADTDQWARELAISRPEAESIARIKWFGAAHAAIEAASPLLAYRPTRPRHLRRQVRFARLLVTFLRWRDRSLPAADPAGRHRFEPGEAAATS